MIRVGVVGLAALAVLSGASYASRVDVAVPADRTASGEATIDYSQRDGRIERSNRDTARPRPTPGPAGGSSATKKTPSKKTPSKKTPSKKTPSKKATTEKATTEKATTEKATTEKATTEKATTRKATTEKATDHTPEKPTAVGTRYTRVDLNVRAEATESGKLVTVLDTGSKISIAGTVKGQWQSIVHDGELGWVKKQYLVSSKPNAISSGVCASGSSVESGLTRDAIAVHRAVCAKFPQITTYGGVRADALPEHPSGRALDCMLGSAGTALGWEIANWLRGNAGRLGISQILFDQRIWTRERGGEGWRTMSSRGGATADHRDHVHVTVYGNAS